jgi:hypothetical protein
MKRMATTQKPVATSTGSWTRATSGINACSSGHSLALVGEMLPELDAVAFRVEEADKLSSPLGVCSDGHGRGLHPVLVEASDDPVDVVDPVVDDVTLAGLTRIAGHDREHQVLVLLGAIELAVVQLDVVGALVGEVAKLPTEMAPIPLRPTRVDRAQAEIPRQSSRHLPSR